MPGDHDVGTKAHFVDRQVSVMDQNPQARDDVQAGQRERLIVIAITGDRMARGQLGELRDDRRAADIAAMED